MNMNNVILQMLDQYEIRNTNDEVNALKEIIQELILSGLSRGDFFGEAAFYGGTALRIFYQLDRFSEDLDFALLSPNTDFDLTKYFGYIEKELKAYGLNMEISTKKKSISSTITSAYVKGNTLEHILKFFPNSDDHVYDHLLKNIKIKFEVDVAPPSGATYEVQYKLLPSPHSVNLYDKESLFAGKIHAILCRNRSFRTKGRDLYDYVFFLANQISVNLELLKNKLIASHFIDTNCELNINVVKDLLVRKFGGINYADAKNDVLPFIRDVESLDLWNKEFFVSITSKLK